MCGILGVILSQPTINTRKFQQCLKFISPRGPDSMGSWKGVFYNAQAYFWHTRLSILDVSNHAHQPMQDKMCNWVITYNGEIYNYIEVREELCALGWSFKSESDTEVLLKAWEQWGLDALPRLNGMFAFAVVHKQTGEVWLVRDRFGVKPLLWGDIPEGGMVFSSSVAAIAKCLDASVDVDYCSFGLHYKVFETLDAGAPFNGVHSIKPGGWLRLQVDDNGIVYEEGCWYDLASAVKKRAETLTVSTDKDLLLLCRSLLDDAVTIRLRSDVPLAVSLSGGLDSTTIAALAATQQNELHGFTYGAHDALQSEGPVVARFTRDVGIVPHFVWPELNATNLDELLERTLCCQEAPFPSLSVMAQNEVFNAVRQAEYKVLLGGQGGDEAFAGYRKFFIVAALHALNRHDVVEVIRLLYSLGLMLLHESSAASIYWRALSRYRNHEGSFQLLDWSPRVANLWGEEGSGSVADRQIEDIQRWSIPTLLRYEDRNSMGHGVESRLPFMDYRLVELALALPIRLKIAKGFGKWAVRNVTQGVVPDYVRLNRKKRGFDVTQSWVTDGLGSILRARICDNRHVLAPHMKNIINLDKKISDKALRNNSNLLDEALMLAWLAEPVRDYRIGDI